MPTPLVVSSAINTFMQAANAGAARTALSLGNVENTALSTWAGTSNITTLGTIATGTWQGTTIADGKIASALTGKTYNGLTVTSTTGTLTLSSFTVTAAGNTTIPIAAQAITLSGPTGARTYTLPDANATLARADAAQTLTGTQTVRAATTQDAIALAGRAGGTSNFTATLTPTTLTANRTITFPDASITVARTDAEQTFSGTQTFTTLAATTATITTANFVTANLTTVVVGSSHWRVFTDNSLVAWTSINSSLTSYLGIQGRRLTLGATASNVFLEAPAAGSMQIGLDHASTATAQGIKAHNVTVGTGASLTLAGGTGSTAGGAVILATSATTGTATAAVTCGADGSVIFDKLPSSAVTLGSNGRMTIEFTNNTTLTFRARGSDGTTRTATLTLA